MAIRAISLVWSGLVCHDLVWSGLVCYDLVWSETCFFFSGEPLHTTKNQTDNQPPENRAILICFFELVGQVKIWSLANLVLSTIVLLLYN